MSVRALASVGVILCVAMTSFSIYLGVIEHAYSPATLRTATLVSQAGRRETICLSTQHQSTATTTPKAKVTVESCSDAQALGK